MKKIGMLSCLVFWCALGWAQMPLTGELSRQPVQTLDVFAEADWASNAASKYVLAGLAFGGDITYPVQSLSSRTAQKGKGFSGGSARVGVKLTLPAMGLVEELDAREWRTTVSIEHQNWAAVHWTSGAARLLFGPLGAGAPLQNNVSGTSFDVLSLTSLKIGGLRSFSSSSFGVPVNVDLSWSINAGEVHNQSSGAFYEGSEYTWDDQVMSFDVNARRAQSSGVGTHVGFDVGIAIEEANDGRGRPDTWSLSISDVGTAHFRSFVFDDVDTSWTSPGLPLITGELPNLEAAWNTDTVVGVLRRRLPSTIAFHWERKALRTPGVVWALHAQKNTLAPRPQVECIRRSGRGGAQLAIGLGYGGWGGTYIPISLRLPSKAVRQGQPGGTLNIASRWLALAGTGGRMTLGVNWHQTF